MCIYLYAYVYIYVRIMIIALTNRLWQAVVSNIIDTLLVRVLYWCKCACNLDIRLQILPHRKMLASLWVIR